MARQGVALNRKTTAGAIATTVGGMLSMLLPQLGIDLAAWVETFGYLLMLGGSLYTGLQARDNDVTSEGLKIARDGRRLAPLLLLILIVVPACSQTTSEVLQVADLIRHSEPRVEDLDWRVSGVTFVDETGERTLTIEAPEGSDLAVAAFQDKVYAASVKRTD